MSYDILAFDPSAVDDAGFPDWWAQQSEWSEDHSYLDPAVTTPELQAFFTEVSTFFPAMNGPAAPTEEQLDADPDLEDRMTDYSIGASLIYGAFAWSEAERAKLLFLDVGKQHGVAVALVSDDSSIHRP